jgi:hypothetical protein
MSSLCSVVVGSACVTVTGQSGGILGPCNTPHDNSLVGRPNSEAKEMQSSNPNESQTPCKNKPAALRVLNALLFAALCFFSSRPANTQQDQPVEPAKSSAAPAPAKADSAAQPKTDTEPEAKSEEEKKREKRGAIVAAPLPISSPALGSGIIPVVGYIFPFSKNDKVSPPSVVGGLGLFTSGGSRLLALGGELYLKEDTYEITAGLGDGHLNYNFYGTGNAAGDAGRRLAIKQNGEIFFGEVLRRLKWKFFLGPRVWIGHSDITPNLSKSDSDHPDLPPASLNTSPHAVGVRLLRDTRPNRFYPTAGTLFDLSTNFFSAGSTLGTTSGLTPNPAPGKTYSYQTYRIIFNKYASLTKSQVLAYNLYLCGTGGEAPFYGQCIFGVQNELQGYTAGRYIDRYMFATQLEYRMVLPKRFGLVGFGGVGEVAPSVGKFNYANLLPSIGTGLRFMLDKKYHVNLRVNVAEGKNGHTWSMAVGEDF